MYGAHADGTDGEDLRGVGEACACRMIIQSSCAIGIIWKIIVLSRYL